MKRLLCSGAAVILLAIFAQAASPSQQTAKVVSMKVAPCPSSTPLPKDKEMPCHEYIIRSKAEEYNIRTKQQRVSALLPVGQEVEFHVRGNQMDIRVIGNKGRVGKKQEYIVISRTKLNERNR